VPYAGKIDPMSPGISPAYGDMTGLPPIVMHTAGDDPLRGDATVIAKAVAATDTDTLDHRLFEGLWHVFHLQVSVLPAAREAVADLGAKLRNHVQMQSEVHLDNAKVVDR
jgi:monoterpene epsilon-lactone hydrolase